MLHPGTDIGSYWAQVIKHKFGCFSFARSTFPTDDHRLIDPPMLQGGEGGVRQQIHMRFLVSIFVVLVKVNMILKPIKRQMNQQW